MMDEGGVGGRACWACRADRAAKTPVFCWLCAGTGALPGNPLERRGRDPQVARLRKNRRRSDLQEVRAVPPPVRTTPSAKPALPPQIRAMTPLDLAELDEMMRLFASQAVKIPIKH
jgi:hypothetical protein